MKRDDEQVDHLANEDSVLELQHVRKVIEDFFFHICFSKLISVRNMVYFYLMPGGKMATKVHIIQ
jgi:hypothetical protein